MFGLCFDSHVFDEKLLLEMHKKSKKSSFRFKHFNYQASSFYVPYQLRNLLHMQLRLEWCNSLLNGKFTIGKSMSSLSSSRYNYQLVDTVLVSAVVPWFQVYWVYVIDKINKAGLFPWKYIICIGERESKKKVHQTKFATTYVKIYRKYSDEVCHVIYRWISNFLPQLIMKLKFQISSAQKNSHNFFMLNFWLEKISLKIACFDV